MSVTPEPRAELVQRAREMRDRWFDVDGANLNLLDEYIARLLADVEREAEAALARKVLLAVRSALLRHLLTLDDVQSDARDDDSVYAATILAAPEALPAEPKEPT